MFLKYKRFFIYIFLPVIIFTSTNYVCGPDKPNDNDKNRNISGCILKQSSNAKDTLHTGSVKNLYGVSMYSPAVAYISGEDGTILRTSNGGINWSAQTSGTGNDLRGIYAIDNDTAVTTGKSGIILRTTNKGISWDTVSSGTVEDLNAVYFPKKDTGYICGNNGKVLKSLNGGRTWSTIVTPTNLQLYDINFLNGSTGISVGQNGRVLKTTTGGSAWDTMSVGTNLYGVDFLDSRVVAVGAGGKIIKSTNYGANWVNEISPTALDLRCVIWVLPNTAYAGGNTGINLLYNGTNWSTRPQATNKTIHKLSAAKMKPQYISDISIPFAFGTCDTGFAFLENAPLCIGPSISLKYSENCAWCVDYNCSITVPFTHLIITSTSEFNHYAEICDNIEMNVMGEAVYNNPLVTKFDLSIIDDHKFKLKEIIPFPSSPAEFGFYLYNENVDDNACFIQLNDIICCDPCEGSGDGNP